MGVRDRGRPAHPQNHAGTDAGGAVRWNLFCQVSSQGGAEEDEYAAGAAG